MSAVASVPKQPRRGGITLTTELLIGPAVLVVILLFVYPFVMPLVRCSTEAFAAWAPRQRVPIVGTSDQAHDDYAGYTYDRAFILLMGSERQGIPPALEAITTAMVRIPMAGKVDSLNLAVATSLMLYEARNQHHRGPAR